MFKEFQVCVRVVVVTVILTGVIYPLCVTVIAKVVFPHQANGSLAVNSKGKPCGSNLIVQSFTRMQYFHPRPSAAMISALVPEASPLVSGGANWGVTSQKLQERMAADYRKLLQENPNAEKTVPVELITASASGLDPHLSPAAAKWQIPRIAKARNVEADRIERLLENHLVSRQFGVLGEPCVSVLELNLAMDERFGAPLLEK
ncbi:MAG: potassium-transporting ATPase subunit KdpC [Planctomycetaceae bacterium]|nr:potassium-transporting ATPase subunit KdpC [Planctomycetaceae bacterium]